MKPVNVFWFRRDLRLIDNAGLFHALNSGYPVLPLFIFDTDILTKLTEKDDKRVNLIYSRLTQINKQLNENGHSVVIKIGKPEEVFEQLCSEFIINAVYCNKDYEPDAIERDKKISNLLSRKTIRFNCFKDQVIFEETEILKPDGLPYTVFTPYSKKWKATLTNKHYESYDSLALSGNFVQLSNIEIPTLEQIGFKTSQIYWPEFNTSASLLNSYNQTRNFPAIPTGTSNLSVHLRFGTVSIREIVKLAVHFDEVFLNELIWREFFMCILFHYPHVTRGSFKKQYDNIKWINNESHFEKWCSGTTGYPIVDAGMRQLNSTGLMHNRVRMITASFLVKHLLIDWKWGEAYFAQKLLDFDLAANNGNWQWIAGSGGDAAPYFRIFNPEEQTKKFDKNNEYIRKWIPEIDSIDYPFPIIEHTFARNRTLEVYKNALNEQIGY